MEDKNKNKNTQLQVQQPTQLDPAMESAKWSRRYKIAKDYQTPMFQRWSKWYDDMYAHIHNQRMAPWRSKVYMPIIASKVWDLISRFIQYRPGWDVSVRTLPINTLSKEAYDAYMEEMGKRVERIKMKLEYDYDNPLLEETIQDELLGVMLDAAVTGQGLGRAPWVAQTSEYRHYMANGDKVDFNQVSLKIANEGYNGFNAVNVFNFFLMPGAKSLQKSPWIIVHDFVPIYELKKDTSLNQQKVGMLKTNGLTNDLAQYEASRNRLVNAQDTQVLDDTVAMAEIFECWDKETNECIIYGTGQAQAGGTWVELARYKNMYWHKKYPFVAFYIRRKPYQFWGESLFENSETLQSAINDIFNHYMDNSNMADGMIAIEEGSYVEPDVVEPGGEFRYRGELPKQFKFPQPDSAGMSTALNVITSSIENATISQYASGIPNSATDTTQGTATGVTRMMEAAAEKVGFMRSNFRRSWRQVGQMWHSNSQQFMRTDVVHESKKNGDTKYEVVRPVDMIGLVSIKIDDGSFEPISKDEKRKNYLDYIANLQGWQTASIAQADRSGQFEDAVRLDWHEIVQRGAEQFGENSSHLLLPTKPPAQPEPEALPAGQEMVGAIPEGAIPMDEQVPLSYEEATSPDGVQADGKSMPDSFPVRSIKNPTLVA